MPQTEILLYGPVGSWFGWTAADLVLALRAAGPDVLIRLHSDGGDALEGIAAANAVRAHQGRVAVQVDGLAASAATPLLCAAAETVLAPGALVMLHEVRAMAEGDAADLRAQADVVEKITASYRSLYCAKTKKSDDEIAALVAKNGWAVGSWLTAAEAVELGLADRIADAPVTLAASRPQARALNSPAARFLATGKGPVMTATQTALRKALGLPATATAAEVRAALHKAEGEPHKEPDGDEKPAAEKDDDEDEPKAEGDEGHDEPDGDEGDDPKALRAALERVTAQRDRARAALATAPAKAADKEAALRADVKRWISEGRIDAEEHDEVLAQHRKGEAGYVSKIKPGTHTTSQRLRGGKVGTETDIPTPRAERGAQGQRGDDPASVATNIIDGVKARASRAMGLSTER